MKGRRMLVCPKCFTKDVEVDMRLDVNQLSSNKPIKEHLVNSSPTIEVNSPTIEANYMLYCQHCDELHEMQHLTEIEIIKERVNVVDFLNK